jgi:hypothetical protein
MSKLKIFYILSLVALGVLLVFTVFRPFAMGMGRTYSEVQREQLLQGKDEWIMQFDIINQEGKTTKYSINVLAAGEPYTDEFLVQDGGVYTYIHHLRRDTLASDRATVTIYKEGETTPFEQITYHLR